MVLIKDISETIKNEAKEQKGGFLGMLLCTLGASLLGNLLSGKGTITADEQFWCCPILYMILKYKNIMKMNLDFMVFIQEIIYLK